MTKKQSLKLKNNKYLDTNSIVHNKQNLKEKLLLPYTLFENLNGTRDSITLNDSVANYQYIEVFGGVSGVMSYQKIYSPNNKEFCVRANYNYDATYVDILSTYSIQNNVISPNLNKCGYLTNNNFVYDKTNYFNIVKIIGYK